MTILDTDILVALLKGTPDAIQKIATLEEKGDAISITIITAYELLKGAYLSRRCEENLAKITETISNIQVLDLQFNACQQAAKIYQELKNKGTIVGEFDILIAAITRANGETLITRDEHFTLLLPTQNLQKW